MLKNAKKCKKLLKNVKNLKNVIFFQTFLSFALSR